MVQYAYGHLVAPDLYHWRLFKSEAIDRCGGPPAFALACEIPLDRSTIEHVGLDGRSCESGVMCGAREVTGAANSSRAPTATMCSTVMASRPSTVRRGEGEWRLGKRHGLGRMILSQGGLGVFTNQTSVGCWVNNEGNGRIYGIGPDGYQYVDCFGAASDAVGRYVKHHEGVERFECAQHNTKKMEGPCGRRFPNGDEVIESWVSYHFKDIVRYVITPSPDWPEF